MHYAPCYWHSHPEKMNNTAMINMVRKCNRLFENILLKPAAELKQSFTENAAVAIYASNVVEDTGMSLKDTHTIVEYVFSTPKSDTCQMKSFSNQDGQDFKSVHQHAKAFHYLCVDHIHAPLSLNLIKETHRLLCTGLVREDGVAVQAGEFRKYDIVVGRLGIPSLAPELIESYTNNMIEYFNLEFGRIQENPKSARMDPIALSTWLKYIMVTIHPFNDGNGRTSRLFLNWALLKLGLFFPIDLRIVQSKRAKRNYFSILNASPPLTPELEKCIPRLLNAFVLESICMTWIALMPNFSIDGDDPNRVNSC